MKKILIASITLAMVFSFGVAMTEVDAASNEGLEESPAFEGDSGHWTHKNGAPRFDTDTHRRAVPGEGAENANLEKSVLSRPGDTLVDPHRTLE